MSTSPGRMGGANGQVGGQLSGAARLRNAAAETTTLRSVRARTPAPVRATGEPIKSRLLTWIVIRLRPVHYGPLFPPSITTKVTTRITTGFTIRVAATGCYYDPITCND
jgi:hypothetical protein